MQKRKLFVMASYLTVLELFTSGFAHPTEPTFFKDQLAKIDVSVDIDIKETAGFCQAKERYTFELLENRNIIKVPDADNLSQYYYTEPSITAGNSPTLSWMSSSPGRGPYATPMNGIQ